MRDLLAGDFEEQGRSKVLYRHFRITRARVTREWLNDVLDTFSLADVRSEYLARCWIPRRMFNRWLAKHELPPSPARFEPQRETRVRATKASDEAAAVKALAARLKECPELTRAAANEWCREKGYVLSGRGFQDRVWPQARVKAELPEKAQGGRKKSSH
jgi:hypothetical protein